MTVFFSSAEISRQIFAGFRWLFGIGMWLVPLIFIAIGAIFIFTKNPDNQRHPFYYEWTPLRVISLLVFFSAILGLINLSLPQNESLALAMTRGGAVGFAISFFIREFFGDMVAGVFLVRISVDYGDNWV